MICQNNAKNVLAESFQCFNLGNFLQKATQQDYRCMLQGQQLNITLWFHEAKSINKKLCKHTNPYQGLLEHSRELAMVQWDILNL